MKTVQQKSRILASARVPPLVNSVNTVNSFNSYSAVLPPSPMVFFMAVRDIFIYRRCCVQSIFSENRFGGQTIVDNIHWIYAVLLMSAGRLRPRRAIFSCASIFPKN